MLLHTSAHTNTHTSLTFTLISQATNIRLLVQVMCNFMKENCLLYRERRLHDKKKKKKSKLFCAEEKTYLLFGYAKRDMFLLVCEFAVR